MSRPALFRQRIDGLSLSLIILFLYQLFRARRTITHILCHRVNTLLAVNKWYYHVSWQRELLISWTWTLSRTCMPTVCDLSRLEDFRNVFMISIPELFCLVFSLLVCLFTLTVIDSFQLVLLCQVYHQCCL